MPTQRKAGKGGQVENQMIEYALPPHILTNPGSHSQTSVQNISFPSILTECIHTSRAYAWRYTKCIQTHTHTLSHTQSPEVLSVS